MHVSHESTLRRAIPSHMTCYMYVLEDRLQTTNIRLPKKVRIYNAIDNDAFCLCMHDLSLCTHKTVRTMYAAKISGTCICVLRKKYLKNSQNDNLSTSFVCLLCQESINSYNGQCTSVTGTC